MSPSIVIAATFIAVLDSAHAQTDWPSFGHDSGAQHHSPLTQINPQNVNQLRLAWQFATLDAAPPAAVAPAPPPPPPPPAAPGANPGAPPQGRGGRGGGRGGNSEVSPLVIGNVMYLTTPYGYAAALDAESGKMLWKSEYKDWGRSAIRGGAYWPGDKQSSATFFFGTEGGYLIALDAQTGKPKPGFATEGALNLRKGIADKYPNNPYGMSSAPTIYKNLVITGSHLQEGQALGPMGDVRAWDVHTGKLVWTFHTIPHPGEPNFDTWTGDSWKDRSGANVWGTMTVDVQRGILYLPLGCTTQDYVGNDRPGLNLYGSSLVALDAATGKLKWYFQTTHHDIWDYDLNAPPALIDITVNGKKIPAVAQISKQALLFVLDRTTGKPVYGIEERPVPQEGFAEDETPWPTQPFPVKPPALARNNFDPSDLAKITPEHTKYCEERLQANGGAGYGGLYVAFGQKASTIFFPSTIGGAIWSGVAFDPKLGYIFANTMNLGDIGRHGGGARFWDAEKKWPCQKPPWGLLTAINSKTGDIAWQVPFGSYPELEALGIKDAGTPNTGGVTATASGLLFASGTLDNKLRAIDSKTGKELWSTDLPAAGHAVPITYQGKNGKQYVGVMVSGGTFLGSRTIPAVIMVYALP